MLKSIKIQLLILIFAAVLPALGIIIYSNYERQRLDIDAAKADALIMLAGLANDHESVVEVTRRLLMTLAKLPALHNKDVAACNKLFKELLKDNTQYTAIYAADLEGMIFANALPSSKNISIKHRKYFQNVLQTKAFSAGDYTIGTISQRAILPFAYPVKDSSGRVTGLVAVSLDLENYGRNFVAMTQFPKVSTLTMLDRNHIRLYRHPDNEKYRGNVDMPEIVKQMSADPQEGTFTSVGVDGIKRLFAYKRFLLPDSSSPYLYIRIGIPEEQALALTKKTFLRNIGLLIVALIAAILIAWLLGHVLIIRRIYRLVAASKQVGQGNFLARTGLDYKKDELGQLARSFDDMAGALEVKELDRKRAEEERAHSAKLQGVLEMAGAICHELNQPMQIISGYSEMLLMNISENDPTYMKLDTINKQVHRMSDITKKLMNIENYETQDYAGLTRIIDIHKSSTQDNE